MEKASKTPHGRFGLEFFFQRAAHTVPDKSLPLSTLHSLVKQIIVQENPKKPVTDERIETLLKEKGVVVSRRTIAKYREVMKIPNTHLRRRAGGPR